MNDLTIDARFSLAGLMALSGGAVAFGIATVAPELLRHSGVFKDVLPFVRVASGGALMAGLLLAPGFGRAGGWGWVIALLSFGAATFLGAVFAWFAIPLEGAIDLFSNGLQRRFEVLEMLPQMGLLAAVMVGAVIMSHLHLLGLWCVAAFVLHLTALSLREG